MGKIINSKNMSSKKVSYKFLLEIEELLNLKGNMKNVSCFCSELCTHKSQINTRGNNGVTKYFKIPLSIRLRKKQSGSLSYQKINTPSKIYYVYTLEKAQTKKEKIKS